jgi:hypothetical protein
MNTITPTFQELYEANPDRAYVAIHEAAHVLCCKFFGIRQFAVSIVPGSGTDGVVQTYDGARENELQTTQRNCIMLAAGAIAGHMIDPAKPLGDALDRANATGRLRVLYGSLESDHFINKQYERYRRMAARIVRERWYDIERIAVALMQYQAQIDSITPLTFDPIADEDRQKTGDSAS